MLSLMEASLWMQGAHEVRSGESAINMVIHTYAGNTCIMHKKFAAPRIIPADAGVLSQTCKACTMREGISHGMEGECAGRIDEG